MKKVDNQPKLGLQLFKKQNGLCWWCKMPMLFNCKNTRALRYSIDHLRPKDGKPRPVVAAHRICNSNRGHKSDVDYSTKIFVLNYILRHPNLFK